MKNLLALALPYSMRSIRFSSLPMAMMALTMTPPRISQAGDLDMCPADAHIGRGVRSAGLLTYLAQLDQRGIKTMDSN
jgi:hypothetical protein